MPLDRDYCVICSCYPSPFSVVSTTMTITSNNDNNNIENYCLYAGSESTASQLKTLERRIFGKFIELHDGRYTKLPQYSAVSNTTAECKNRK